MNVKKGLNAGCSFLLNVYKGLLRLQPYNLNQKKSDFLIIQESLIEKEKEMFLVCL